MTLVNISSNSEICDEPMLKRHCVEYINVDLNQETKFVPKRIKEWIQHHVLELYNNEGIEVSVKLDWNYKNLEFQGTSSISYNAENYLKAIINCFICKLPIFIPKLKNTGHLNKKWIYFNYYKHIRTHQSRKECKGLLNLELKNGTLDHFIGPSNSEKSKDENKKNN